MLGDGTSVVRRGDGTFYQPRELVEVGVGMCGAGRETAISGCPRAESYSYIDLLDDRMLGALNTDAEKHTDASAVWCLPVHGRRVAERSPVLRQNSDHADARQVSAGLHVSSSGKKPLNILFVIYSILLQLELISYLLVRLKGNGNILNTVKLLYHQSL